MIKKLAILVCLVSFAPAAVGAQDVALIANAQPVQQSETPRALNLMPSEERAVTMVAANDIQGQPAQEQQARKTHTGLSWKEFCDVHFGEGRWIYWAGAVAAIVAIHVVAAD